MHKTQGEFRRAQAKLDFAQASTLAAQNGLRFSRLSETQYHLKGKFPDGRPWLMNVYPGNCRIYHDPNKRGPFIDISFGWGLLDVVEAAIKAMRLLQRKGEGDAMAGKPTDSPGERP